MVGCAHKKKVKAQIEIWLIEEKEPALNRTLKNGAKQILPIKDNVEMQKFMCIDKREYKGLYKSLIDKGD